MKLWVYTFCWNEEKMLPFFLRHYGEWLCAEKIVVYDNQSTDNSLGEIARWGHLDIEVRQYGGGDNQFALAAMKQIRDEAWHEARGKADWVAIVDMDEFLFHNDIFGFFERVEARGMGLIRPYGFEMVSREFPKDDGKSQIWELVRTGVQHGAYSKPILLRPDHVAGIDYSMGAHDCKVAGTVRYMPSGSLRLLHFKRMGWDYFWNRIQMLKARTDPLDIADGHSQHYVVPMERHWEEFNKMIKHSVDVTT